MPMSYDTLVGAKSVAGSIRSWQNYDKVDAEGVLEDAQAMIYQSLRVREMRTSETILLLAGDDAIDLPERFLDPVDMRDLVSGGEIEPVAEGDLGRFRSMHNGALYAGEPTRYAIINEQFTFDVRAKEGRALALVYFRAGELLSADNQTNFLTRRYPHILRAMSLAMAAEFSHNTEEYARNLQRANGLIAEANAMDDLSRRGQEAMFVGA